MKARKDGGDGGGDEGGLDQVVDLEAGACHADQPGHDEAGHEREGEGDAGEGEDGAVPGGEDQAGPAEQVQEAEKSNLPYRITLLL